MYDTCLVEVVVSFLHVYGTCTKTCSVEVVASEGAIFLARRIDGARHFDCALLVLLLLIASLVTVTLLHPLTTSPSTLLYLLP